MGFSVTWRQWIQQLW